MGSKDTGQNTGLSVPVSLSCPFDFSSLSNSLERCNALEKLKILHQGYSRGGAGVNKGLSSLLSVLLQPGLDLVPLSLWQDRPALRPALEDRKADHRPLP